MVDVGSRDDGPITVLLESQHALAWSINLQIRLTVVGAPLVCGWLSLGPTQRWEESEQLKVIKVPARGFTLRSLILLNFRERSDSCC